MIRKPSPQIPFEARAVCSTVTPDEAARLLVRLSDAVQHSHDCGILHRDIKPANVLLFPLETAILAGELPFVPRLSDFGLAKVMEQSFDDTGSNLTLGTLLYMSPEQVEHRNREVGPRTDVFGLGSVLYEALTGQPPFLGKTVLDICDSIRSGEFAPVQKLRPEIPVNLAVICEKSLSHLPEDRYGKAAELRDDLLRFLAHDRIRARPRGTVSRLWRATELPARIGEAAAYLTLVHAVLLVSILVWLGVALHDSRADVRINLSHQMRAAFLLTVVHLLNIWFGWNVWRRRLWFAWSAMAFGGLLCLAELSLKSQWISALYTKLYPHRQLSGATGLLSFGLFAVQTIVSLCAARAIAAWHRKSAS